MKRGASNSRRNSSLARLAVMSLLGSLLSFAGTPAPASHDRLKAPAPGLEGRIVFEKVVKGGDVYVMNADGSEQTALVSTAGTGDREDGFPAFSTDATRVVFASCRDAESPLACRLGDVTKALGNANIFVTTPAPNAPLTQLTTDLAHDTEPQFSHDATRVVFTSFREGNAQIFVMNSDGSSQENISDSALTPDSDPAWSPHPGEVPGVGEIAFVRQSTGLTTNDDIFVMNADGSNQTPVINSVASERDPAWSPDGTKIAFSSNRDGDYDIWYVDLTVFPRVFNRVTNNTAQDSLPAWSPDGTEIAFASNLDGTFHIWVANADGTGSPVQLTSGPEADTAPHWVENFLWNVNDAAEATTTSSPSKVPVRHFPIVSNSAAPDLEQAPLPIGLSPLPIGLSPLPIGLSPLPIGLSPLPIGLSPFPIGLSPLPIGLSPFPIGLSPLPIGLSPFPIGLSPDALGGLGDVLLSTIPLRPRQIAPGVVLSWQYVLEGSALAANPLQSVSYKDLLGLIKADPCDAVCKQVGDRLRSIDTADIDFSLSPLGRVNKFSIALGLTSLNDIDPTNVSEGETAEDYWCGPVEAQGYAECGDSLAPGTSDARDLSPLELELSGVSISSYKLQAIPLGDITMNTDETAFLNAKVGKLYLGGTVGGIKLSDLANPTKVVNCSQPDCSDKPNATLNSASADIKPDATVADLEPDVNATVGAMHLGEFVFAMMDIADNPAFDIGPLHNVLGYPGFGSEGTATFVTYNLEFAPVVKAINKIRAVLPGGFAYGESLASSIQLSGAAPVSVTPAVSYSLAETVVTWELPAPVAPGTRINLSFDAHPGLRLGGPFTSTAVVLALGIPVDSRSDRAGVTVTETFEPNDSPATAAPAVADTVFLSHISAPGDLDYYSFPAPPAGSTFDVYLGHVPSGQDYDVVVYAPGGTLPEPPLRPTGAAAAVLPVEDTGFPSPGESAPPDMLQDIPIVSGDSAAGPVVGVSINRSNDTEEVRVVSSGSGTYIIQVSGYNGSFSDLPYSLRVRTRDRFELPTSPVPYLDQSVNDFVPTSPVVVGTDQSTLILVNEGRMRALWGVSEAAQVLAKLGALSVHPSVNGAIVRVDASLEVRNAYKAWDQNPSSPAAANDVVRAINAFVDSLLSSAHTITHVLVVGPDSVLPFARLADRTLQGNERSFTGELLFTGNNPLTQAFFNGFLLSDNPYGDFGPPVPWLGGFLYVPDVGLGRVVETPGQIKAQIDLFRDPAVDGKLNPTSALTAGADFMTDLATQTDQIVESMLGASQPDLIETNTFKWSRTDLETNFTKKAAPPHLVSLNAHFDFARLLPPAATDTAGLFTATDIGNGNTLPGRIIWSMGCHSGVNLPDSLVSDPLKAFDWAQAVASKNTAVFVAQNGFGLGLQPPAVGLSEQLMKRFALRMAQYAAANESGSSPLRSLGRALAAAKKDYVGQIGLYGVYDEKVVHEATFYGLPFFQDPTPTTIPPETDQPPLTPSTNDDPVTHGSSAGWSVTPSFQIRHDSDGDYYQVVGVDPCAVHYRPLEPCSSKINVTNPGLRPWALVSSRRTAQVEDFNPLVANPLAAANASDLSEPVFEGVHPSALTQISPLADQQFLVANVGQFRGNQDLGVQRLDVSMGGTVFWLPVDGAPPAISTAKKETPSPNCSGDGCKVTFTSEVSTDALQGYVLFLDDSGSGIWRFEELEKVGSSGGTSTWSLSTTYTGPGLEFIFEFVGPGGVALSSGKGLAHVHKLASLPTLYEFAGPHPPDFSKTMKTGSTIPVKFELFREGVEITDPKVVTGIRSYRSYSAPGGGCDTTKPPDLLDDPATTADDPKAEDATKVVYDRVQFKFEWKTDTRWGNTCRVFEITADDGSRNVIRYYFKS